MRVAVPRAWVRARRTILSADTVSFLAAAILYYFAAADVKGFAFTLGLSTILDLVVVFLFTHPLVSLLSRSRAFGSPRFTGLDAVRAGRVVPDEASDRRSGAASRPVRPGSVRHQRGRAGRPTAHARRSPALAASRRCSTRTSRRPTPDRAPTTSVERRRTVAASTAVTTDADGTGTDGTDRRAGRHPPAPGTAHRRTAPSRGTAAARAAAADGRGPGSATRRATPDVACARRLYRGETRIDFIGNRKRWYSASAVLILICVAEPRLPRLQLRRRVRGRHAVPDPGQRHADSPPTRSTRAFTARRAPAPDGLAAGRGLRLHAPDRRQHAQARRRRSSSSAGRGVEDAGDLSDEPDQRHQHRQSSWGHDITVKALAGPDRLPDRGLDLHRAALPVAHGRRRHRRAAARPADRRGHLLDRRLRGHAVHRRRPADHPRFLALRHGRRLRQGRARTRRTSWPARARRTPRRRTWPSTRR